MMSHASIGISLGLEQNLYVVLISAVSNLLSLKMNRSLDRDR